MCQFSFLMCFVVLVHIPVICGVDSRPKCTCVHVNTNWTYTGNAFDKVLDDKK